MGGDLNGFRDIKNFMIKLGGAYPRGAPGYLRSMPLNASYHEEQEYIWFMGGDLNNVWDITHFMK